MSDGKTLRVMSYVDASAEWGTVKDELIDAGKNPSAYDVSEEQRRRAEVRGERPPTYDEIMAEARDQDSKLHKAINGSPSLDDLETNIEDAANGRLS